MPLSVNPTPFVIRPPADLPRLHPEIVRVANDIALRYASRELVTDDMLRAIGSALWAALDIDEPFATARETTGLLILPLAVQTDDPALQQLPWETLHHPQLGFLGQHKGFTLSRVLGSAPVAVPEPQTGPLRVLLFTSLPDDLDPEHARLDVEEEQAQVQEALAPWFAEGVIDLHMPDDGRFSTFEAEIRDYRPHLVFLSGHGSFHHQPHSDAPPYGSFLFEGEDGGSKPVAESEIADAFTGAPVECLVLSACESGKAASDALSAGLARHLAGRGLPHVIGMRESILDRAGIRFARAFCDTVAEGNRVDAVLQQARRAITRPLEGGPHRDGDGTGLAELSLGQWCLPMLLSRDPGRPLVDWGFTRRPPDLEQSNQTLENVTLPPRFLGRRAELRDLRGELESGRRKRLLITGPGGQGKTALAGKLALGLRQLGYRLLVWSARPEHVWSDFQLELELLLSEPNARRYDAKAARCVDEHCRARLLLGLLADQFKGRVLLFFDNLESIQNPRDLGLKDERAAAWIAAARGLADHGLRLLLTSRWRLPDWPEEEHWSLEHATYGDFLQFARTRRLPAGFLRDRDRLRRAHLSLHGNFRGLEFFAAAVQEMNAMEGEAFLAELARAETEIQADMALERIVGHRGDPERELLRRLPAYGAPVPLEGIVRIGLDLEDTPALLDRLLAVSLVERTWARDLLAWEYQCPALVSAWLEKTGARPPAPETLKAAADYQLYLLRNERQTLAQGMAAHQALERAGERDRADSLALERIVGRLSLFGLYRTLLDTWLPPICKSADPKVRADALNLTGKQHLHLGDYDTALQYLKQSLAIRQEIGDTAGLCATLFNIGHIHWQNKEQPQALSAWVSVYRLAKPMGLAQALDALEALAGQLGLPGGLDGWEQLAQQMEKE